ncbi:MAG: biotin--[acetyl-CoA-carboxylase] ligase [Bauldia sp.]|nr:biotin--[acetyl-CoA-carboxylase] ligase [Bauldia sp.]
MAFHLGPDARAAGFRLDSHDTVGSTNAEALAAAAAGDPGRLWVAAAEQTAGVGRRGRKWHTPAGNLAATVFTVTDVTPTKAATLGFVAGLALDQALHSVAPALPVAMAMDGGEGDRCVRFALKWPNDVLADGAKIAGILLQTVPVPGDRLGVIVGMGVNVVTAPSGLDRAATSLRELGCAVSAEALFAELTDAWVGFERLWDDGRGLGVVRELWLERASGVGEAVAVRGEHGVIRGVFETIDPEGRLVIRAPDGALLHVTAGEVHFGIAATAGPAV